jgi:hypothetical protein
LAEAREISSRHLAALARPGANDRLIAEMTRERRWRPKLLRLAAPAAGETIWTPGAVLAVSRSCLGEPVLARAIGIDPDEAVLTIARGKVDASGVTIE